MASRLHFLFFPGSAWLCCAPDYQGLSVDCGPLPRLRQNNLHPWIACRGPRQPGRHLSCGFCFHHHSAPHRRRLQIAHCSCSSAIDEGPCAPSRLPPSSSGPRVQRPPLFAPRQVRPPEATATLWTGLSPSGTLLLPDTTFTDAPPSTLLLYLLPLPCFTTHPALVPCRGCWSQNLVQLSPLISPSAAITTTTSG